MRTVCFVEHLEFEFSSSVFKNGIALGDVDNDGETELIVGSMIGELVIFKHDKCWQKINNLGMITAIGVGDIMNCGSNALVIVCGDGWCHICLCLHPKTEDSEDAALNVKLEPVHVQRIPPNTKALLLEDVDGDGNVELVLGLTDRVVRMYRWMQSATGGRLVCLFKWESANQIGGLALNHNAQGLPKVLVAQPGGTVMRLSPELAINAEKDSDQAKKNENLLNLTVEFFPLMVSRMRNPSISTEIVADIKEGVSTNEKKSMPYLVATLDGTFMFIRDQEIIWSHQVDHQIFALSKLDVTGDGKEEVIACSWDGQTYILDQDKHSVRFHLQESVSTFCAGLYTLQPNSTPVPCFVYVTYNNKILLYHNIHIESMVLRNYLSHLKNKKDIIRELGPEGAEDKKKLKEFIFKNLYAQNKFNKSISDS